MTDVSPRPLLFSNDAVEDGHGVSSFPLSLFFSPFPSQWFVPGRSRYAGVRNEPFETRLLQQSRARRISPLQVPVPCLPTHKRALNHCCYYEPPIRYPTLRHRYSRSKTAAEAAGERDRICRERRKKATAIGCAPQNKDARASASAREKGLPKREEQAWKRKKTKENTSTTKATH